MPLATAKSLLNQTIFVKQVFVGETSKSPTPVIQTQVNSLCKIVTVENLSFFDYDIIKENGDVVYCDEGDTVEYRLEEEHPECYL